MKITCILGVLSLILIIAGCGQGNNPTFLEPQDPLLVERAPTASESLSQNNDHPIEPTPRGDLPQLTPTFSTPSIPHLQSLIEKAKEDLAQRFSISLSQIDLVQATEVIWPDSSLGCPQKGMAYAEVLTPGYLIILSDGNMEYEYHASKGTEVIYCVNPTPPVPGTPDNV